jgi:hypothetical protein
VNPAYATIADLAAAPWRIVVDNDDLLVQASLLLDDKVRRPFAIDDGTKFPTDPDIAEALKDAACAQVAFWADVGEEHDVEGLHHRQVSIGHLSMASLPPELGPRAQRILALAGLLSSTSIDTTAARFFATQTGT